MTVYGYDVPRWSVILRQPFVPFVINTLALLVLAVALSWVPPMFHTFAVTYLIVMTASVAIGYSVITQAWWLVWLVGTLVWSLTMLALCVWQLLLIASS